MNSSLQNTFTGNGEELYVNVNHFLSVSVNLFGGNHYFYCLYIVYNIVWQLCRKYFIILEAEGKGPPGDIGVAFKNAKSILNSRPHLKCMNQYLLQNYSVLRKRFVYTQLLKLLNNKL